MNGFYWIYLVMFVFLLAYHFVDGKDTKVRLYYAACGFLILMFALQDYSVSGDSDEYMLQYGIIKDLPFSQFFSHKFEIGYVLLNRLLSALFESDRILYVCMGILILVPFALWMEKESPNPMLALMSFVAVGFYFHSMVLWRQMFAMAILTFSYRYVRERKLLPFLFTVLIAMLFHQSAAVFLLVYPAYALPVNKWLVIGAAGISAAMIVLGKPIMWFVNTYIYSTYNESFFGFDGGITMLAVLWVFTLLVYWLMRDRMEEPKIKLLFGMMLIAVAIHPVVFTFGNWFRIVMYFRIAMVLLIPELYATVFKCRENNRILAILERWTPGIYRAVLSVYDKKWFHGVLQIAMFAILFFWYISEMDGEYYILAPVM